VTSSAVVAVGDELLDGTITDGNGAWLGRRLAEAGAPVVWAVRVGDEVTAIRDAILAAVERAPYVVVSGGLGPTDDDVTRDALALLLGGEVKRDPELVAVIERWYAGLGRAVPAAGLRQADVPAGAVALANPVGSAPVLRLSVGSATVWAVPGVPRELFAVMDEHVLPVVAAGGRPLVTRSVRTAVAGETLVAQALEPLAGGLPPGVRLGYLAAPGEVRVRLTTTGSAEALVPVVRRAEELLGDLVVGDGDVSLEAVVHELLLERSATVATAESLTGGLVGAALTSVPGASSTYRGGVVAYATPLKTELLSVDAGLLAAKGAVHPQVAEQMAVGVRDRLGATYGLATTGVAGPDEQDGQPVGTLHLAVAGPNGAVLASADLGGGSADRTVIRRLAVVHALDLLRRTLQGRLPYPGKSHG
jgi:nicotinamide-nucleotide amidase